MDTGDARGKGIYAWDPNHRAARERIDARIAAGENVGPDDEDYDGAVFVNHDIICEYGGEVITSAELNRRYGNKTAPYGIGIRILNDNGNPTRGYRDGACERGIGSVANAPLANEHANAAYVKLQQGVYPTPVAVQARERIYHGQQILVNYGDQYEFNVPGVTHSTRSGRLPNGQNVYFVAAGGRGGRGGRGRGGRGGRE